MLTYVFSDLSCNENISHSGKKNKGGYEFLFICKLEIRLSSFTPCAMSKCNEFEIKFIERTYFVCVA